MVGALTHAVTSAAANWLMAAQMGFDQDVNVGVNRACLARIDAEREALD
jgi:hypothetical protein